MPSDFAAVPTVAVDCNNAVEDGSSSSAYGECAAIDGDLKTAAASGGGAPNEWLSVQVAPDSPIGYVVVYDRSSTTRAGNGLFNVYVGNTAFGDLAYRCEEGPAAYPGIGPVVYSSRLSSLFPHPLRS